ncbi:5'-methylthioadenosine/S-adenosylhomocysteine nucleosidase [Saccharibacillus sp. O23]|uniref:5'-methylthioadenosine/adenosylhomocysteine nucleosidase n=1 Tax=Saccharibacillus sp. O23 TaxID=2009338 RepID=UPI000B4E056E|nr:5'-methylthioadenosine/adenosylhomocysteine nucleosidase [Saccharibacillus sp. O23]OWR29626.1 5'-methylthioadenosine/S-adenosylhomocysteine nucleosidase [Saccharibacillus sp. O23]
MSGPIALMGAMDEEIKLLLDETEEASSRTVAGIAYTKGRFRGHDVVICRCGIGKVNAAAAAQILISEFGAQALIFTGVAGALDPELEVGDIVVSSESLQHDMDVSPLGYAPGIIPDQSESCFKADSALIALAEAACESEQVRYRIGRVLSGDRFVADKEEGRRLREAFDGACTEMEGAAVAQVCWMNEIPHVVIRSMSDKANGEAPESFAEFTILASVRSHAVVAGMLDRWNASEPAS